MKNAYLKAAAATTVTALAVLGYAGVAGAQTVFDPGGEATGTFDANWAKVLDLVKDIAPYAIGGGLVLLGIRKVAGSLSRGRPTRV